MKTEPRAILFDMGGTLHHRLPPDPAERPVLVRRMLQLLGAEVPVEAFYETLSGRARAYQQWAQENLSELGEEDLWRRWMLPDQPGELVAAHAMELNTLWRTTSGRHIPFADTAETVLTLFRQGYRLGVVSNTTSSTETPRTLAALQIAGCFDTVILSCVVGRRKPDPALLLLAAERMGVEPAACVYVGDRTDRDVVAARAAGFGGVVILRDPSLDPRFYTHPEQQPDHFIDNIGELPALFPPLRAGKPAPMGEPPYDASLSTMWGVKKFVHLEDFFIAAGRLGFDRIELNHQVGPERLEGIDLGRYRFSSVHEPCPATIPAAELKKRDMLISSPDEERRRLGVQSICASIDLAARLDARLVVVHCGQIQEETSAETEMRAMVDAGLADTPAYREKKARFSDLRAAQVAPYMEALHRSIITLLDFARPRQVRLGLENRYHFLDLPNPDELEQLLGLGGAEDLGFLFDSGHAATLERLGFYPTEEWLQRFGRRILGVHIHDVIGLNDHNAPGMGDLDFRLLAPWLGEGVVRTLELHHDNTPEQVRAGLKILEDAGCIHRIK